MKNEKFSEIMEALNIHYRITSSYQNTQRYYGIEELLYQADAHIIQMIGNHPGISLNELADKTYRSKSAMSVLIKSLSKKNLVLRQRDEKDNRRYMITLTENGHKIYNYHQKLDEKNYKEMMENMNALGEISCADLESTLNVLNKLNTILSIKSNK